MTFTNAIASSTINSSHNHIVTIANNLLELSKNDSPLFRVQLHRVEDALDDFSRWIDGILTTIKEHIDDVSRTMESLDRLCIVLGRIGFVPFLSEQRTGATVKTVLDLLSNTKELQDRMIKDLGDSLITPLMQSVQDDMIKLRELRRLVEKSMDKYDNFHLKLGNNSNRNYRGPYEIKDDNAQLEELYRIYFRNTQEYIQRLNRFIVMIDNVMVEKVIFAITDMIEFSSSVDEFYQNIKPFMNDLKGELTTWQRDARMVLEKKSTLANSNLSSSLSMPSSTMTTTSGTNTSSSVLGSGGGGSNNNVTSTNTFTTSTTNRVPHEKSAYVFRKKMKSMGNPWKRIFMSLQNTILTLMILGKERGTIEILMEINVLLCEFKLMSDPTCFELQTSQKTLIIQVDTEEELKDWIRTFENAKNYALQTTFQKHRSDSSSKGISPTSTNSTDVENKEVDFPNSTESTLRSNIDTNNNDNDAIGGNSIANIDESNISVPPLDNLMDRVNYEFHLIFVNAPSSEQVQLYFSCILQRDLSLQGKAFITNKNFYFHSSIFGFVTNVMIPLGTIENISVNQIGSFTKGIRIKSSEQSIFLKTSLIEDVKIIESFEQIVSAIKNPTNEGGIAIGEKSIKSAPTSASVVGEGASLSSGILTRITSPLSIDSKSPLSKTDGDGHQKVMSTSSSITSASMSVSCDCSNHLEKTETVTTFPIPVNRLYEILFGDPEFKLGRRIREDHKDTDIEIGDWKNNERIMTYQVFINNPLVKGDHTKCIETLKLTKNIKEECFVVSAEGRTPDIMYGDSFTVRSLYCITRVDGEKSKLRISVGINWIKNPLMKSVIKAATLRSFSGYATRLTEMLKKEIGDMATSPVEEASTEKEEEEHITIIESEEGEGIEKKRDKKEEEIKEFSLSFMKFVFINKFIYYGLALTVLILSIIFSYSPLFKIGKDGKDTISSSTLPQSPFTLVSFPKTSSEWLNMNLKIKYGIIYNKHEQLNIMQTQLEDLLMQIKRNKEKLNEKGEMIIKAEMLIKCYSNANRNVKECEMMERKWLSEKNKKLQINQ